MLSVEAEVFLKICNKYPLSKEIFHKRAIQKRQIFQNYKNITLLKYMKTISKNPKIITDIDEEVTLYDRVVIMKEIDIKI